MAGPEPPKPNKTISSMKIHLCKRARLHGMAMMHILVAVAVLLILVVVGNAVYSSMKKNANKKIAVDRLKDFATGIKSYADQNNGVLPLEGTDLKNVWETLKDPATEKVWYNAIPKLLGKKTAADFGANYPDKKKIQEPMFAFSMNGKLQGEDRDGRPVQPKFSDITNPSRTIAFFEGGLKNEKRTLENQSDKDYDGSAKGSAKSFVGRYSGQGAIGFFDGHAELVDAKEILNGNGQIPTPQSTFIWTAKPEEDPNDSPAKKKK
jgi:prepilin-type processing-associated H-X9-DG protein